MMTEDQIHAMALHMSRTMPISYDEGRRVVMDGQVKQAVQEEEIKAKLLRWLNIQLGEK